MWRATRGEQHVDKRPAPIEQSRRRARSEGCCEESEEQRHANPSRTVRRKHRVVARRWQHRVVARRRKHRVVARRWQHRVVARRWQHRGVARRWQHRVVARRRQHRVVARRWAAASRVAYLVNNSGIGRRDAPLNERLHQLPPPLRRQLCELLQLGYLAPERQHRIHWFGRR
jgi:hypothetical protein